MQRRQQDEEREQRKETVTETEMTRQGNKQRVKGEEGKRERGEGVCAGIGKKQLTGLRQLIDKLHAPTTSKSDSNRVEQENKTEKREGGRKVWVVKEASADDATSVASMGCNAMSANEKHESQREQKQKAPLILFVWGALLII